MQRQQARAQVWPILEYASGNEPELRLWLANKGVGPALIRHVVVTVDGNPVADRNEAMCRLFGEPVNKPGRYSYSHESLQSRVFSAGESLSVFTPHFDATQDDLRAAFDKDRFRVGVEICYCSTLGDCWTLLAPLRASFRTVESGRCPAPPRPPSSSDAQVGQEHPGASAVSFACERLLRRYLGQRNAGAPILRRTRLTLDYRRKQVFFEPA